MSTFDELLENYVLYHDIEGSTADWYRRVGRVMTSWHGRPVRAAEFTGELISRLLLDKKRAGNSDYYLRSLRSGLVAILRDARGSGPVERVRSVRTGPLKPGAWTAAEVERLLAAIPRAVADDDGQWYWTVVIALAYYTGFDRCDVQRITRADIRNDGLIPFFRSKTGRPALVAIPAELLGYIDQRAPVKGAVVPLRTSPEYFRRVFKRIVAAAGLKGTFKKIRKTSGTLVESEQEGRGHVHLANTRSIFERHYQARELLDLKPTMPPKIDLPASAT